MTNQQNFERAKRLMSKWPEWKRNYKLTKYSWRNNEKLDKRKR